MELIWEILIWVFWIYIGISAAIFFLSFFFDTTRAGIRDRLLYSFTWPRYFVKIFDIIENIADI